MFKLPAPDGDRCTAEKPQPIFPRFRPRLEKAPLTHAAPPYDHTHSARAAMQWSQRDVQPSITLTSTLASTTATWRARRDLLNSSAAAEEFVAEIDNDGGVRLRFGDDRQGKRPEPDTAFSATYRVGNGKTGNIGADSLVHIAANIAQIVSLRNPLPARGGRDPESLEDVRQRAPVAYRVLERAVTEADYAEVTERHTEVQRAAATFRWTGSWHTVFVAIHPVDAANLRRLPGGGTELQPAFARVIKAHLTRFKLAGYDLDIRAAIYVPLEIDIRICVGDGHFRGDVLAEVQLVLSNRRLADGTTGFFFPLRFGFGSAVYLSKLYAAITAVQGVNSAEITRFKRYWDPPRGELDKGAIAMTPFEIARLDNDRNFPENGVLRLSAVGGL